MSLVSKSGLGQLTAILEEHLQIIQKKDATVEQIISTALTASSLHEAKKKALENEKSLLLSIMEDIGEMTDFLNNIILIENLYNGMYQPFKQKQEEARAKYAPTISKYENKSKVQSAAGSFVELVFAGQTHVSSFQTWLDKVVKQCQTQNVKFKENSGAKVKKIERAFYKCFYVYSQQDGHNEMTDMIRASIVFDNFDDLYKCFSIIELMTDDSLGGILRVKDRFHPNNVPFGYRDLLINIRCPGSKIIAEIQLHFIEFYKYKKVSHKMYKRARLFERDTGNLAYEYATKFMRPKIGTFKVYEASKDEIDDDDDSKSEPKASEMKYDQLLKQWDLESYVDKMKTEGWDDVKDWQDLEDEDLKNDMGFSKGHIKRFRRRYQEWLKQVQNEKNTGDVDKETIQPKDAKPDIIAHKVQEQKVWDEPEPPQPQKKQKEIEASKLISSSDMPGFARAVRNGWNYHPGRYLSGYSSIGSTGFKLSQALDKCLQVSDASGINIQYNEHGGELWTLRKGGQPTPAGGYHKDNLCCLVKPPLPKPSKQIPGSDQAAFEKAICDGWGYCPGRFLGGYSSIGSTAFTMAQALDKCLKVADASGINLQHNEHGGKFWTLRKGKVAGTANGYDENNLVCLIKPEVPSKLIQASDMPAFKRALRNGWKYCPGKYLGGYSSIGSTAFTMSEALDQCLEVADASGINIQHDEHGGRFWTLRRGSVAATASGYHNDNLCCFIKPEAQKY